MSGKLVSQILLKNIPEGKLLVVTLASHCFSDSLTCWPSRELLARECQMSERQLYRVLSHVKALGYVTVKQRQHRAALFTLCPDKIPDFSTDTHVTPENSSPDIHDTPALTLASLSPDIHDSRNKEEPERTGKGNRKFVRPALTEIRSYCEARHNRVDPEKFSSFYKANGWKVGKNPMRDWKAAVRYWERNEVSKPPADLSERNRLALERWEREHKEEI